ncbi:LamG-like jellyroll fold domain-containing protein [Streptomyces sp. NPDC049881]|uniref:LamG-like jellyroll fold domain-containing protein n=1 Tax=Streptomyces sp. NPDC049881 TaxID=3155778 RepID=UPI003426D5EB
MQPSALAAPVTATAATPATEETDAAASEEEALTRAARTGRPVQVLALQGESSDVYATPQGTLEAREYLRPVRARVDGRWQDIDTDLSPTGTGLIAPAVTTVDLAFSAGGGEAPLARLTRAGRTLQLFWPGTLPTPQLDGDTAVYHDVLPDVDLRMGAQPDGFTQLLVVHTAQAAENPELSELALRLDAGAMTVEVAPDGRLEALDEGAGSAVFEAPAPLIWDSSTESAPSPAARGVDPVQEEAGTPGMGESARQGRVEVEVTGEEMVLTPDTDILQGEGTQYPVFIDPQWYSPRATAWTMASRYWHDSPQWMFNGENNAGLGYCGWDGCAPRDLKRLFYRLPTSRFAGTEVVSAEFVVRNVHSASCTGREVQLWRTKGINSSTTWDSQNASGFWVEELDSRVFAYGYDGCAARDAEFNVTSAVREAADNGWSTLTFGMQATSESDPLTWKRFSDAAFLRVEYNRPPPQIRTSQLSMQYGGSCRPPSDPARVKTRGQIHAVNVTDPDGDSLRVEFGAQWDTGDGQGNIVRWNTTTTSKRSGSTFSATLPASIPVNRRVEWFARSYDGRHYSPWSSSGTPQPCAFVYDTGVPTAPAVTSPQYPEIDTADPDDPWHDGVGKYGSFTFDAPESDVVRYEYVVTDPTGVSTTPKTVTTSGGAARTVDLLPETAGVNRITVRSFDAAANGSEQRTYLFSVRAGEPERMVWGLDEEAGAESVVGEGAPWATTLSGDAAPGGPGVRDGGLHLGGANGYASTATPVLDTSKSFSVSLWARLPEGGPATTGTAASQAGWNASGFQLSVDPGNGGWSFSRATADTATASTARARQNQPAATGEWTHVVGVFKNPTSQLLLYLDGRLAATTSYSHPWEARGATALGAALIGSTAGSFFSGDLDEVALYDYWLSEQQITQLSAHQPITEGARPAKTRWSLDEPADAVSVAGRSQTSTATLHGGVTTDVEGVRGTAIGLDGATGYADAGQPVLDTHQSFAVSAWVKLPVDKANRDMTVAAQSADNQWGFALVHAANGQGWTMRRWNLDETDATVVQASQQPCSAASPNCAAAGLGHWAHVVGVHDMDGGQIRLYVNGRLAASETFTNRWTATGPVTIGAARHRNGSMVGFLSGQIDDVRLFDRVVTGSEARQLFEQSPQLAGRWQFERTDATGDGGRTTPDSSAAANALRFAGAPAIGPGWVDHSALLLDGVDDHAAMTGVPVDTTTSFSVAAWAQAAAAPDGGVTLVSAAGAHHSAFSVRFVPDAGQPGWGAWQIVLPDRDGSAASMTRVDNAEAPDVRDWNHVALVYDGFRREAQLYVNGRLAGTTCATEGDEACRTGSSAENVLTFGATGSLQVGRTRTGGAWGEYWPGAIDDLWLFQGSLSPLQVAYLAAGAFDAPTEVP